MSYYCLIYILWFLGVINTLGGTEPITITLLVLVLFSAMVQGLLIFGLWKRIRPILVLWLVIEFLTTIIVFGGIIASTVMIEMIAGKDG